MDNRRICKKWTWSLDTKALGNETQNCYDALSLKLCALDTGTSETWPLPGRWRSDEGQRHPRPRGSRRIYTKGCALWILTSDNLRAPTKVSGHHSATGIAWYCFHQLPREALIDQPFQLSQLHCNSYYSSTKQQTTQVNQGVQGRRV